MSQRKKDSIVKMIFVLTLICFLAGLSLSYTYNKTRDKILDAEFEAKLKSVKKVLPPFDGDAGVKKVIIEGEEKTFYLGRKQGSIIGVATASSHLGYGGTLSILVGIDLEGIITGVALLEHQETPGLGAKAGGEAFLGQFKGKYLSDSDDKIMVKKDGGDIDSITSATITSRSVAEAATKALRLFMQHKKEVL